MGPVSRRRPAGAVLRPHSRRLLAARQQGNICLPRRRRLGKWLVGSPARLHPCPRGEPHTDHERSAISVRLAQRQRRRTRHCGTRHSHRLVGRRASNRISFGSSKSGSWVFELAPLRDSPQVNDKVKLTEDEVETLSPMRRLSVNKPLSIAYGTGELPAMIATSRDYHAYRLESHLPGDLIPIAKANHFTILDELRLPDSHLTRQVLQLATYNVT